MTRTEAPASEHTGRRLLPPLGNTGGESLRDIAFKDLRWAVYNLVWKTVFDEYFHKPRLTAIPFNEVGGSC